MIKMKSLLLLLILVLTAACTEQKATQTGVPMADNEENRLAVAKEYLKIAPPKDLLQDIALGVSDKLPEQVKNKFMDVMTSKPLEEFTYQANLKALVKNFTVNELQAMTAFFSTPEGKSCRQKFNIYMADFMSPVYQEVAKTMKPLVEKDAPKGPQTPQGPKVTPEPQTQPTPAVPQAPKAQPAPPSPKPGPPAAK